MPNGARTPEELETLLEDAFLLCDNLALVQLFEPTAVLVAGGGLDDARGHREIARVAAQLWDARRTYLADPRRVLQARDAAIRSAEAPSAWSAAVVMGRGGTPSRSLICQNLVEL